VTGLSEAHRAHLVTLRGLPATVDDEGLRIGDQYVMFFAEADLMRQLAIHLLDGVDRADVLEVGLGLGVFAEQAARLGIGSYAAIEPHPGVARLATRRVLSSLRCRASVLTDPWQLVALPANAYDAIMYDTWPPDGHADDDFAAFVENVALPCLRPAGRFSFFHSGTALSPARTAVLDRHFAHWRAHPYTMPATETPVHWTKPSCDFLIPIAYKGG
jgi:spermidine synthase